MSDSQLRLHEFQLTALKLQIPIAGMATPAVGRLGQRTVIAAGVRPERGHGVVRAWECREHGSCEEVLSVVPDTRSPTCLDFGDVDGDGQTELIVGTGDGDRGGHVYVLRGDGTVQWRSPHIDSLRRESEIAVADFDGDGADEIAVAVNWYGRYVTLYDHVRGEFVERFRHGVGDGHSVAGGDVDGDGLPEIVFGLGAHDGRILTYDYAGGEYAQTSEARPYGTKRAYVTAGPLFGNGRDQIVVAWGKVDDGHLSVLDAGRRTHHIGPFCGAEQKVPATYPVVADVWNEGVQCVVFRLIDRPRHAVAYVPFRDGDFGTPFVFYPDADAIGRPLVADVDGDGRNELILPERRGKSHRIAVYGL